MRDRYDVVIVGMGSAGLTAAQFALRLGLRVAAVERDRFGGDCLWTGCVPSKAVLAAARMAATGNAGRAASLGVKVATTVDGPAVLAHLRQVRDDIATDEDDPERYVADGADVVFGAARLGAPGEVIVTGPDGERRLRTRHVLIATGSRAAVPRLDGLDGVPFHTNETIFELDDLPDDLAIVGGGPMGVELAQAFARLGTRVTLLHRYEHLLPRDEPELTTLLADALRADGVDVRCGTTVRRVEPADAPDAPAGAGGGVRLHLEGGGDVTASTLLLATGRVPNITGLGLADAGVEVYERGVLVDDRLRTTAPWVWAAGDVIGGHEFTHAGAYEATVALRNALLPGSSKAGATIPWCTFSDPELAHVGLTEAEARERYGRKVRVLRHDVDHTDRGRTDALGPGRILLVLAGRRIVGAHVLAPGAGELIGELTLAVDRGLSVLDLASTVHVYPALATGIQQAAATGVYDLAARLGPVARVWGRITDRFAGRR